MTPYKFLVGVVLTVAMVSVLVLAAVTFSARDFQYGIAQLSGAGSQQSSGMISFARLDDAHAKIAALREETSVPRGQLDQLERTLRAVETRSAEARAALSQASAAIVGDIAAIEARAGLEGATTEASAQALADRIAAVAARPGLAAADQQALVTLRARVDQLAEQEAAREALEAERAELLLQQASLGAAVAQSNNMIAGYMLDVVPNPDHFERIRDEVNALRSMSPWGISAHLAQGHPAQVSTLLVVLMGALGSLLYLFPAYLNRAVPVTMAEIVVRLIFGMCSALALYVLANAAVASFSMGAGPEAATTSALLNPFTVSLVGIVAGVLSEDIAQFIQDRGRGMFQQGGGATTRRDDDNDGGGMVNPHAIS